MPRDIAHIRKLIDVCEDSEHVHVRFLVGELKAALDVIERMFERVVSHDDCDCKDCVVMREWAYGEEAEKR